MQVQPGHGRKWRDYTHLKEIPSLKFLLESALYERMSLWLPQLTAVTVFVESLTAPETPQKRSEQRPAAQSCRNNPTLSSEVTF